MAVHNIPILRSLSIYSAVTWYFDLLPEGLSNYRRPWGKTALIWRQLASRSLMWWSSWQAILDKTGWDFSIQVEIFFIKAEMFQFKSRSCLFKLRCFNYSSRDFFHVEILISSREFFFFISRFYFKSRIFFSCWDFDVMSRCFNLSREFFSSQVEIFVHIEVFEVDIFQFKARCYPRVLVGISGQR